MRLFLVRHALPSQVRVESGRADPELSETGHRQAAAVAAVLAREPIDAIWSSTLRRAVQTAEPTAAASGLPVRVHDGLSELDSRMASYDPNDIARPDADLTRAYLEGDWSELSDESPEQFHARIRQSIDEIVAQHRGQTVAVFTHGGVINAWLACVSGAAQLPIRWFLSDYAAINRFVSTGSTRTFVESLNDRVDC